MTEASTSGLRCPDCSNALRRAKDAPSWCPECEWNLGVPEADEHEGRAATWRRQLATRLTMRDFARIKAAPAGKPGWDLVRLVTYVLAAGVQLFTLGLLIAGIWLVTWHFPSLFAIVFGAIVILIAIALRPRFGRLEPGERVVREEAPALFALIDDVAAAVGTRTPDIVQLGDEMNASYGTVSIRRFTVLRIGLPLWMLLAPQQRVAVLAHELGHAVNGDARRGLIVGTALRSLAQWCELLRPTTPTSAAESGILVWIGELIARALLWALHGVTYVALLIMMRLVYQTGQRAEYYADEVASRVASSQAVVAASRTLLVSETCQFLMEVASRRKEDPAGLVAACASRLTMPANEWERRERVSIRTEPDLFASHPPTGLRIAMVQARALHDAQVTLTPNASARIDTELARHYARVAREIGRSV